jgi:hypothetical protein
MRPGIRIAIHASQPERTVSLTRIEQYEVMYASGRFLPRIGLKSGGRFIGQMVFMPDGAALPDDSADGDAVTLYYHHADFANVLDLLRNEQPMYLQFTGPGGENGIKTTPEPVGEGEA